MRIIVEGIDGLGKSTLCQKISNEFTLAYYHPPKPLKDFEKYSYTIGKYYKEALQLDNIVYDRLFFSEYAYNYARTARFIADYERLIDNRYILILLYVTPGSIITNSKFWLKQDVANHRIDEGKLKRFEMVNERYLKAFDLSKSIFMIKVDFNSLGYEGSQNEVIKFIREIENEVRKIH